MKPLACACTSVLILASSAAANAADEDDRLYARIVSASADLRSGPGVSHRVVVRAERGETFVVSTRATSGHWLEVLLPDGRSVWLLGDAAEIVDLEGDSGAAARVPGLFSPPALEQAHGGFALLGGVFDLEGYAEFRPSWVLAPAIALEPYAGLALQSDRQRLLYGVGAMLNLAPDWAVAPFTALGAGGSVETPADEFVGRDQRRFHARAGGGLLVSLRFRIMVRGGATHVVLFTEDSYENAQIYTAGIGTYF